MQILSKLKQTHFTHPTDQANCIGDNSIEIVLRQWNDRNHQRVDIVREQNPNRENHTTAVPHFVATIFNVERQYKVNSGDIVDS